MSQTLRQLMETATAAPEPQLDGLLDRVPAMLATAHRQATDPGEVAFVLVRRALPRLSLATALLLLLVLFAQRRVAPAGSASGPISLADDQIVLQQLVLHGSLAPVARDPVLRALAANPSRLQTGLPTGSAQ